MVPGCSWWRAYLNVGLSMTEWLTRHERFHRVQVIGGSTRALPRGYNEGASAYCMAAETCIALANPESEEKVNPRYG